MKLVEFSSGEPAPDAGPYEELNVFGTQTGKVIVVQEGETFPAAPRGFSWRSLSALSVAELRERAAHFRAMAGTATTEGAKNSLLKLGDRFDALATKRESGGLSVGTA